MENKKIIRNELQLGMYEEFVADSNNKPDGDFKIVYANGNIRSQGFCVKGKRCGIYKFYPKDDLMIIVMDQNKNGDNHGVQIMF